MRDYRRGRRIAVPNDDRKISPNWYLRSRVVERALLGLQPRRSADREVKRIQALSEQT